MNTTWFNELQSGMHLWHRPTRMWAIWGYRQEGKTRQWLGLLDKGGMRFRAREQARGRGGQEIRWHTTWLSYVQMVRTRRDQHIRRAGSGSDSSVGSRRTCLQGYSMCYPYSVSKGKGTWPISLVVPPDWLGFWQPGVSCRHSTLPVSWVVLALLASKGLVSLCIPF